MLTLKLMVFLTDLDFLFKSQLSRYFETTKFMHCIIFTWGRVLFNNSTLIIWASTLARKVNFEKKNWREIKGGSRCRLFVLDIWCHPTQHSRKLIFLSPLASLGSQCGWLFGQEISRICVLNYTLLQPSNMTIFRESRKFI